VPSANKTASCPDATHGISSTVASPVANQLSQQAQQHQAASPHSSPLTNSPMQQTHL